MKKLRNLLLLVATAGLLASMSMGCATLTKGAAMAGIEAPKTEEVELKVGTICPTCSVQASETLNPFPEPVMYTKVGIPDVDSFVESSNNLYGTVMLAEKMIELGNKMSADPNMKVEGFTKPKEVLNLAKDMLDSASKDAPNLLTQGQTMVTDVSKFADPSKALVLPTATDQITLSLERLNTAQGKIGDLLGAIGDAAGMTEEGGDEGGE